MELPYSTTIGKVQLKDGPSALCSKTRTFSPGAIFLGSIKSIADTPSGRKKQKCQKTPIIEGPDYCHPTGLVGDC